VSHPKQIKIYQFGERKWSDQYCSSQTNLGVTGPIQLNPKDPGTATQIMTLCSQAFTQPGRPDELPVSTPNMEYGDHLAMWEPKSLTFLHECFHVAAGAYMLTGNDEICWSSFFYILPFLSLYSSFSISKSFGLTVVGIDRWG
jgi:hypothetical protein